VSRRSRRGGRPDRRPEGRPGEAPGGAGSKNGPGKRDAPGRPPDRIPFLAQVGLLVAVFAATVGIAELAGAINLGTSFGIAQIVFAIVLVALLLRA
jgi:hypothetical protein